MLRNRWKAAAGLALLLLIVIQFFQPSGTNPPSEAAATFEAVAKPSPEVSAVVRRACRDCHSNQTIWPWYSRVAPVSWLVVDDVQEARVHLNFSEWNRYSPELSRLKMGQVCEEAKAGKMPLWYYLPMHPEARLGAADVAALCAPPAGGK